MVLPGSLKEITTAWLNEALHANGFLKQGTDIIGLEMLPMAAGEGFQSDMARLVPAYSRNDTSLPQTMIAKLPTSFEAANYVAMLFNTYEREIRFYKEVAPRSPLRVPRLIFGEFDAVQKRYVLILQDCAFCSQVDQIKGLSESQLRQVVLKMAEFHAHWWGSKELASLTWMPGPRSPAAFALVEFYRSCWDTAVQSPDFLAALPPKGIEAGQKIYEYYQWMMDNDAPTSHLTITHFDFRGDNLFFDAGNKEDPVVVFDWQAAVIYRSPIDIAYLMGGSILLEMRRRIERDVCRLYYDRLLSLGVKGYSWDEFERDYKTGLLIYAYIPALAYSRLDISSERGKELARVLTERHFSAIVDNDATSLMPP